MNEWMNDTLNIHHTHICYQCFNILQYKEAWATIFLGVQSMNLYMKKTVAFFKMNICLTNIAICHPSLWKKWPLTQSGFHNKKLRARVECLRSWRDSKFCFLEILGIQDWNLFLILSVLPRGPKSAKIR